MELSYIIFLGLAVSIDGFFAGVAYGIKQIKVPFLSLLIIGTVTLFCTGFASYGSSFLAAYLNPTLTTIIGSILLISIGLAGILRQFFAKPELPEESSMPKNITFSIGKIVISIMAKPECADMDKSNRLNTIEAMLLGIALGIDNMVATFAAGLVETLPIYTPLIMCIIQSILVYAGIVIAGRITTAKMKERLSYAPGIVLICLGFLRLF